MTSSDAVFSGSIPELYQQFVVPMLFDASTRDIAARAAALRPERVLETAAGTGVVTRALTAALPDGVPLMATDLNPAMLAIAEAGLAGNPRISWRTADMQALPFADAAFDLVVCQFGVMFLPDKPLGYREARRVLAPGGSYIFNVWDGLERNDFPKVGAETLASLYPLDPPKFTARTPFGYHDMGLIARQLTEAGFSRVTTEAVDGIATAPSARAAAIGICQATPTRFEIETHGIGALEEATEAVTLALERRFGRGRIEGAIRWFVVTAEA